MGLYNVSCAVRKLARIMVAPVFAENYVITFSYGKSIQLAMVITYLDLYEDSSWLILCVNQILRTKNTSIGSMLLKMHAHTPITTCNSVFR